VLALVGGLCAFVLRSHVVSEDNAETACSVSAAVVEP
jgi:hypothetical protein